MELIEKGNSKTILLEMADKDDCIVERDSQRPFFFKFTVSDALWLEKRVCAPDWAFLWAVIVQCHSAWPHQNPPCALREQAEPPELTTHFISKNGMSCT